MKYLSLRVLPPISIVSPIVAYALTSLPSFKLIETSVDGVFIGSIPSAVGVGVVSSDPFFSFNPVMAGFTVHLHAI